MSRRLNLYEAKTQLSSLVEEAAAGETIVIAKNGTPMAQLGPILGKVREPRRLGQLARHAKGTNWEQWWREWKAADKEIERDFEAAASRPLPSRRGRKTRRP